MGDFKNYIEGKPTRLYYGDKIIYHYEHALNSQSRVNRHKNGKYLGAINHTVKHWRKFNAEQMVAVQLEGNKNFSVVPLSAITVR